MKTPATDRPILFSGPMVKAILSGDKTQTRRVVTDHTSQGNFRASQLLLDDPRTFVDPGPSPAGNPGPYLKAPVDCYDTIVERLYPRWFPGDRLLHWDRRWRPSIHMQKWACRIWLEVTGVRVERVQAITEDDARAEGLDSFHPTWHEGFCESYREQFATLWDSLNAKRGYGWDTNPWVWVIDFKVVNDGK